MTLKLTERDGAWHVVGTVTSSDGTKHRVRKSTGVVASAATRPAAEALLSTELSRIVAGVVPTKSGAALTAQEIADLYLKKEVSASTRNVVLAFAREFGPRRDIKVVDIQTHYGAKTYKASSLRRELTIVQAMFAHARDMGYAVPALVLKKPPDGDYRERWLSKPERKAFLEAAYAVNQDFAELVEFLFFTGARCGEAMGLRGAAVLPAGFKFGTRKGKSRKMRVRVVPWCPETRALIKAREKRTRLAPKTSALVFLNDGVPWITKEAGRHDFYGYWAETCERAGSLALDFKPHDCRHTFASLLVQGGAPLKVVAELLGHTNLNMVTRYAHLAPSHLSDALAALADVPATGVSTSADVTRVSDVSDTRPSEAP